MSVWPEELNHLADRGSWSFKSKTSAIRSDFDRGPARTRRRFTRSTTEISFTVLFTYTEFEIFKSFVDYELKSSVRWFTMPVFQGSEYRTQEVRFLNQEEPYEATDAGYDRIQIQLSLETKGNTTVIDEDSQWLLSFWGEEATIDISDRIQVAVNVTYPDVFS